MAQWLRGASQGHDMEVMGSNPGQVELWVRSTSVQVILEPNIMLLRSWTSPNWYCYDSVTSFYKPIHLSLQVSSAMIWKMVILSSSSKSQREASLREERIIHSTNSHILASGPWRSGLCQVQFSGKQIMTCSDVHLLVLITLILTDGHLPQLISSHFPDDHCGWFDWKCLITSVFKVKICDVCVQKYCGGW